MRPFQYVQAQSPAQAVQQAATPADSHVTAPVQYLAGGTTLIDLMRLDVMRPEALVDIKRLAQPSFYQIQAGPQGLRIGALVTMAEAADHPVLRRDYPVLSEALWKAASPQLRNMATLGGNALQRTRCLYFRDVSYAACNKRKPGSGCSAIGGVDRMLAILGTSPACIASYPGDWSQGMIALDAGVEILGPNGVRTIPFAELHRLPGNTPHVETTLLPGELITAFLVPAGPHTRRSLYLKVRDRESYDFALASAAVALDLADGRARDIRIALGGLATKPWRAWQTENALRGQPLTEENVKRAAGLAFVDVTIGKQNGFKVALGRETIARAVLQARDMEI
jgi:xanthine dehydrogenase YagS FAD-binding subunit